MNNLFVMHTQYNLILSAAVMSRTAADTNTLVLWSEFALNEEMTEALSRLFDKVIIANESYIDFDGILSELKHTRRCVKKVRDIADQFFDRIYISQERVFDRIVYEAVRRKNPEVVCVDIEEDAYYSLNNKLNAQGYVHKSSAKVKLRARLLSLGLSGYKYDYKESGYCYGMSAMYDRAELLFPTLARDELKGKELGEITREQLLSGINAIYSERRTSYPSSEKYMVMFFDLMCRYNDPETVKQLVRENVKQCTEQGITVLMKYHPRETEKFSELEGVFEIDKLIPAEKVLYDLRECDVTVFGNATTACIVAAKLGYKVYSICKLEIPENTKMHRVMSQMGIECISDIDSVKI